jgi:hypothetical protein
MTHPNHPYSQILAYLKGLLSNRQRHAIEREVMREKFEEEALEGFNEIAVEDLEPDILELKQKLAGRIKKDKAFPLLLPLKIAASVILIFGLATAIRYLITEKPVAPRMDKIANKVDLPSVEKKTTDTAKPIIAQKTERSRVEKKVPVASVEYMEQGIMNEAEPASEAQSSAEFMVAESYQSSPATPLSRESKKMKAGNTLKAKVVDKQGNPLPGVTVEETGTSNKAATDSEGIFEISLTDKNHPVALNYIGYVPMEITSKDISENTIVLNEEMIALEEVAVVGYGTVKKSQVTGAVSTIRTEDITNDRPGISTEEIQPIPPTGSYSSFRKSIYKNLDRSKFENQTEKLKVVVEFIVYSDGSLGEFNFKQPMDQAISSEIKRAILDSGKWQPGRINDQVTDSKVRLRLVIEFGDGE